MTNYDRILHKNIIHVPQGTDCNIPVTVPGITTLDGCNAAAELLNLAGVSVGIFACTMSVANSTSVNMALLSAVTSVLTPSTDIQHVFGLKITLPDGTVLPEIQGGAIVTAAIVSAANTGNLLSEANRTNILDGGTF
jgi:hypothetical protein